MSFPPLDRRQVQDDSREIQVHPCCGCNVVRSGAGLMRVMNMIAAMS